MTDIIKAPFTDEQVIKLNEYQHAGKFHPFTGIPKDMGSRRDCPDAECLLKATNAGWVCPCGDYTQDWAWEFMTK